MVREATARLYDVDEDSVVYVKPAERGRYDEGTIEFRAKPEKRISLDKLLESLWATRLSGGTRSGSISLEVTAEGQVAVSGKEAVLLFGDSARPFALSAASEEDGQERAFQRLLDAIERGDKVTRVTGKMDGWKGKWPPTIRRLQDNPHRLFVTGFETER